MSTRPATTVAPHPSARRTFWIFAAMSAVCGSCSAFSFAGGAHLAGVELLALGGAALFVGFALNALFQGIRIANAAVQRLTRGQLDEAEALLGTIPKLADYGIVRRAVRSQRATIALVRGDVDVAIAESTVATETWLGLLNRASSRLQNATAHAIRALAYAAKGDAARVEADAKTVEAITEASPEALAKVALARAVILGRSGKVPELAEHLRANATLLHDCTEPRERVVVRALARMTKSQARSVYREPAKASEGAKPNALAGFVAMLAPEAAAFADDERPLAEELGAPTSMPASVAQVEALTRARAQQAGSSRRRTTARILGLWLALIFLFLGIWQFLAPAERQVPKAPPATVEPEAPAGFDATMWVPPAVLLAVIVVLLGRNRRTIRRHSLARRDAALGNIEGARRALWSLANSSSAYFGAAAWHELARLASTEGQFLDATRWCDAGLRRLSTPALRATASDLVLPGLYTELAVAKAALGEADEAAAELAILGRDFPDYAFLPAASIRVRLVAAAHEGELEKAAQVARERTAELPLPRREELLADLVVAATSAVSDEERRRLAEDLAEPGTARWVEAVAPRLRDRALAQVRVAPPAVTEEQHEESAAEVASGRA